MTSQMTFDLSSIEWNMLKIHLTQSIVPVKSNDINKLVQYLYLVPIQIPEQKFRLQFVFLPLFYRKPKWNNIKNSSPAKSFAF